MLKLLLLKMHAAVLIVSASMRSRHAPVQPCSHRGTRCGALRRQLGIVKFELLKPLFLEVHAAALAVAPGLPGMRPLAVPLERGWGAEEGGRAPLPAPAQPLSLTLLEAKLQVRLSTGFRVQGIRPAWRC